MRVLIDAATPAVAVTIFGGLISATLLDMLLTPVLFLRYGGKLLERLRRDPPRRRSAHATSSAEAF